MPGSDWASQFYGSRSQLSGEELNKFSAQLAEELQKGGKEGKKKKTNEKVTYKGKERVVYVGPRGGKYVLMNKKYISINK